MDELADIVNTCQRTHDLLVCPITFTQYQTQRVAEPGTAATRATQSDTEPTTLW